MERDATLPDEDDFGPPEFDAPEVFSPFDPRPYRLKETRAKLCVFDSETDPFAEGRVVEPFTCGFTDGDEYIDFWGADCCLQFVNYLRERQKANPGERLIIYCHNFGGFDYRFLADYVDEGATPSIINGRIASVFIAGQEFRDSYRILPVALKLIQKDDFDYSKMERDVRELHRDEILLYQRHDCEYLLTAILDFFARFGDRPTIGNTSMNYLKSFHGFETIRQRQDEALRPYFMGGRCQAFMAGVFHGSWKVYDVNSMYPSVMRDFEHPISAAPIVGRSIQSKTAFVCWEGVNRSAVPVRTALGDLDFTQERGRFYSTIHEIQAGLDTGSIRIDRIIKTTGFEKWSKFDAFIDHFYNLRLQAKLNGDKLGDLFYKLIMNSAYGKFAQNPEKYMQFRVSVEDRGMPTDDLYNSEDNPNGWRADTIRGDVIYWAKPSHNRHSGYFNVGIGASITGAARSVLLRAIQNTKRLAYCDTDSLICEALEGDLDNSRLGAWGLEAEGDLFACGGKKMYALFSMVEQPGKEKVRFRGIDYWCIKKASKGAALTAAEILKVAQGDVVRYVSDRPNFKLDGSVQFVSRDIKRTS